MCIEYHINTKWTCPCNPGPVCNIKLGIGDGVAGVSGIANFCKLHLTIVYNITI